MGATLLGHVKVVLQGLICHVGFAVDGQQFCVPTCYARIGETLFLHGSAVSRMLKTLAVIAGDGMPSSTL